MKIKNLKLKEINREKVYYYTNNKNKQIKELKLKKKTIAKNSGYYLISGKIKIADGTIYPAILGISSDDSGELFEAYFLLNDLLISQGDKSFLKEIKKKKNHIFPYKYHLNVRIERDENKKHQF